LLQILLGRLGRGIAAVKHGVHRNLDPGLGDETGKRSDLSLMRVHAARRHQPEDVRGAAFRLDLGNKVGERRHLRQFA
jgi:hypothetical protein